MSQKPSKGVIKRFNKGVEETNSARSNLRSTEQLLATQRANSTQLKLDDDLQSLATGLNKLDGQSGDKQAVSQQLVAVQQQVEQVKGENEELRGFFQEALQEAERLKHENEELRKLGEDAVLDQQLSKALQETDKLKLAADAYKKELLQQKVSELQAELVQTNKNLKAAEEKGTALSGGRGSRQNSLRQVPKLGSQQSLNGLADNHSTETASLQISTGDRQALLTRLQGSQHDRGDLNQLLAAASKAVQDAGTLEAQLAEAQANNAQLKGEVEKLNDTVFSKTFRAPSAWAEREVKYKMEKKAWDTEVDRLQGTISKLQAENVEYRDNSKTDQFEDKILELQQKLHQTEAAKVTAERAVHELQLDLRSQVEKYNQLQESRRHQKASSEDGISSMIEGFDQHQIGLAHPRKAQPKTFARQPGQFMTPTASSSSLATQDELAEAGSHTRVQDVVTDLDTHHIGLQQPHSGPQEEADSRLHNQPVPDVISQQPSTTYVNSDLPASRQQPPGKLLSTGTAVGSDFRQSNAQTQTAVRMSTSQNRTQSDQSGGSGVFPQQQNAQSVSSSGQQSQPRNVQQSNGANAAGVQEAAGTYQQQHPSGGVSPSQQSALPQRQPTIEQPAIHAKAESTSYTRFHADGTPYTALPDCSSLPHSQQAPTRSDTAPSADRQASAASGSAPERDASAASTSGANQYQTGGVQSTHAPANASPVSASGARADAAETPASASSSAARAATDDGQSASASTSRSPRQAKKSPEDRGAGFPAGPVDADRSDAASDSEDDLMTVKDAVTHIVRSNRQSRSNSTDRLDQLPDPQQLATKASPDEPSTSDSTPPAKVNFADAGHISLGGTSSLPPVSTPQPRPSSSRDTPDMNGAITDRSESSEGWSEERIRQLEEDKAAIERLWGEHAHENDIGVLKFKLAEFESRCEMYEAQVTKMQRSLERGDDEKAKVEEQLATAMAYTASGDKQGLAALRERLSNVVTGRGSKTSQLEDRLKEAEEQLQQSFRERARLEKQKAQLEHELASWSSKLGVSIDLPRTESVEDSEPSDTDKADKGGRVLKHWQSSGSNIAGLGEGDMEVMRLREENEALMESLVRTKVELAETEGEYLKNKRSLIRANEKLAGLSEKVESMKLALGKSGVQNASDSPSARSDTSTQPFGTPKSAQASTPKGSHAAAAKF